MGSRITWSRKMEVDNNDDFSQVCFRNLAAISLRSIEACDLSEEKLQNLVSSCTVSLLKKAFTLPREESDDGVLVRLPTYQTIVLPRSQHLPSSKSKTRWQKFAELKNIKKKKRSRLIWDPVINDWAPRWGKGSAKKNWKKHEESIIELKDDEDFRTVLESRRAKPEINKAKQQLHEHRNKVEAAGGRLNVLKTQLSLAPLHKSKAQHIKDILSEVNKRAAVSTASYGVFKQATPPSKKKIHRNRSSQSKRHSKKTNKTKQ